MAQVFSTTATKNYINHEAFTSTGQIKLYSSLYMIPNSCGTYDGHALFPLLMHFIRSFMDFHYLLELQTSFHALPVYFVGGGFHSFELHFSTHPN